MKQFKRILQAGLLAAATLGMGLLPAAHAADKPTIKLGYVQSWPSSDITTHLAAAVIKQRLGNPVDLVASGAGPMWEAVASDHTDAMLTAWLPTTHKVYYEKLWQKVVPMGPNVTGTRLGIAVPKYVPVNTIAGLKKYAGKFQGRIVGVGAGAGINIDTEKAIKAYGLSGFHLQTSSVAAMTAQLKRAIKNKQWIAVTAWTPMWMWAKFDIKFLKDPKHIYGKGGYIGTMANPALAKKSPAVYAFLNRFAIPRAQLSALMLEVKNGTSVKAAVGAWIKAHPKMVNSWVS
ncbi:glycine betaine ABC transporter substrate-binding protein [Acidihalobacter ferrooxydans]|uniref:Glycine/betaine ABC transporter substrate-binding protein n=1 Tax=Acidihalobacter ferrooxydans TaxID=1765967 RepID=A0A1P8UKG0_9GAMM|nr:glycine betaine ABC transporter substrate-binding protein [Acidihalobacter ferrooxydans]APZ44336.1 glycine/betaine ABC transporter substrate-binding protein [Acidihalobacter ferrooxydans]